MALALVPSLSVRRLMVARDLLLPLLIFTLPFVMSLRYFQLAVVAGAQYHFVMSYWYQYRSGKMNQWYLLLALSCFAGLSLFLVYNPNPLQTLFLITSVLFSTHFAIDEVALHNDTFKSEQVVSVFLFVLLHMSIHLALVWPVMAWLVTFSCILFGSYTLVRLYKQNYPSQSEKYLWYLALIFIIYHLTHLDTTFSLGVGLMSIVVLHLFNWLIGYGIRVHGTKRERRYWLETLGFIGFFSLFAVVYAKTQSPLLVFVYGTVYYYCWAIGHILLSGLLSYQKKLAS